MKPWSIFDNQYIKVLDAYLSVFCLSRGISLTAEPIWSSFTVKILIDPGKVCDYFLGGYHIPQGRNRPSENNSSSPLETFRGVANSKIQDLKINLLSICIYKE